MFTKIFVIISLCLLPQEFFAEIQPEKDFGYYIGDVITTRVKVRLPNDAEIKDHGTVREKTPDLEFKYTEIIKEKDGYIIEIYDQVFLAPEKVVKITIPPTQLRLESPEGQVFNITIPTRTARISPLLQYPENPTQTALPTKFSSTRDLMRKLGFRRESQPIKPRDLSKAKTLLYFLTALSLGLLFFLIFLAVRHKIRFNRSPFFIAVKELKKIRKCIAPDKARLIMELKVFQKATDSKASKAVFLNNIEIFLRTFPENKTLAEKIKKIYKASEEIFFKDIHPTNSEEISQLIWNVSKELAGIDYDRQ